MNMKLLEEYNYCIQAIIDSNFENFISYKKLFKLVYEASNSLSISEFKSFCKSIDINPFQAKAYYNAYDRLFKDTITEFKISNELAKRAKNWDKSIWLEFSKLYIDDVTCRKTLFFALVLKKLKYGTISIPIEKLTIYDVKRYKHFIDKHKKKNPADINKKFKSIKTRLNNFINKEFKVSCKANNEIMTNIKDYQESLFALIEANIHDIETYESTENEDFTTKERYIEPEKAEDNDDEYFTAPMSEWDKAVHRYKLTELYKLYDSGNKLNVNWENPYYAVIFLGLDIFNLPSKEEYRKLYKELIMLFHPDNKTDINKQTANLLLVILNDINLNVWGINSERYLKFINSVKFSLMNLGV